MRRFATLFILTLLASYGATFAANTFVADQSLPLQIHERDLRDDGFSVSLDVQEPTMTTVMELDAPLMYAEYPISGGFIEEEGFPFIPSIGRAFRVPLNMDVRVELINAEFELLTGVDYASFIGADQQNNYGESHPVDEWYPEQIFEVSSPAMMHDFRFCNLLTFPVQVNTARREVRVYSNIEVDIQYVGIDNPDAQPEYPTRISRTFLPYYRRFLDWDETELDEYELYHGKVQVVMEDDDVLRNAMNPYFEWKRQKGWDLEFLTSDQVNWTPQAIRQELRDRYAVADPKFDFVVLIGDVGGAFNLPTGTNPVQGGYGDFADYYYQKMDDNDIYQDVIVGRISVRTEQEAAAYANKVLLYEKTPYMAETDWYKQGTTMAAWDYAGTSTIACAEYVRHEMFRQGYTSAPIHISQFANAAAAVPDLNAGVTYYHFRGGIGCGLSTAQILSLIHI